MLSIWERNQFISYDHIVIGAGIVGLSTAFYLRQRYPSHKILVLERGLLPSGASTRNAGFACMGSPTELLDDLQHHTQAEVLDLFLLRKRGLNRLRQLLGDDNIGYSANGSYELLHEKDAHVVQALEQLNNLLFHELGGYAFRDASDKLTDFGFNKTYVHGLIENIWEGELDSGLMMASLIQLVLKSGIEIKTGCLVDGLSEAADRVIVHCRNPLNTDQIDFYAAQLYVCTNAFATDLLPDYDIVPGRGQVLLTKPIPNLPFKGIFHFDAGYYYFRAYKGSVLFGGGRNLDKQTEQTTTQALNNRIQTDLIEKLTTIILPDTPFEIDLQWSGIMAFGRTKKPILQQHSKRIFVGVRMGGMGVAIGTEVGYQLANLPD